MPSDWMRCGRCGYPAGGLRKKGGSGKIIILLLIFSIFIFRNELVNVVPDSVKEQFNNIFSIDRNTPDPQYPDTPEAIPGAGGPTGDKTVINSPTSPPKEQEDPDSSFSARKEKARNLIHDALLNADESVVLPVLNTGDDSKAIFGMIEQIRLGDPEIMFYEGCTYRTDGLLTLKYEKPRDSLLKAAQDTKAAADDILSRIIKPGMTDYEKELAIHDYIVGSCQYDIENFSKDTVPPEGHEAYGPLIAGKAVCEGYAKAMQLLLNRVDIECLMVTGTSKGELHGWNIVRISGKYYQVDATWDDPVMDGGEQVLQHTYFNLTDKDLSIDHTWENAGYPACNSTAGNYYYYNKLVVSSPDDFTALLDKAVKNGLDSLSVRFESDLAKSTDIPKLLEKAAVQLNLGSLSYSVNDDHGVVDIWF